MGPRPRLREPRRDLRRLRLARRHSRAVARFGARGAAVRDPAATSEADSRQGLGVRCGSALRSPPVARRRERRRGRLLPPRPRAEAPRLRGPVARQRERVPRRRSAPRLCVSAVARLPRPRGEGLGSRPRRRRAPRADGSRAVRDRARLCGRVGAVPPRRAGRCVGGSRSRDGRDGARRGGCVHGVGTSRDRVPSAARPGRARARARGDADAELAAARLRRRRVLRAGGRPSDLRALSLDPVRGLPRRPLALAAARRACRRARPRGTRRPGCGVPRLAPPRRGRHRLGHTGHGRARPRLREVRGPARRDIRPLLGRPRALRPDRRRRARGAAPRAARRARRKAPLGGVRRRRLAGGVPRLPDAVAVHSAVGRRLALPVAPARGVPATDVRVGRRDRRAGSAPRPRRRPGRSGSRDRLPAPAPGRLRVHARARRPSLGDLVRRVRRGGRPRLRPSQAPGARAHRSTRVGARPAPDIRARLRQLGAVDVPSAEPALSRAPRRCP